MLHENAILSKRLFEEIFTHSFCRLGMGGIFHSQFFLRQRSVWKVTINCLVVSKSLLTEAYRDVLAWPLITLIILSILFLLQRTCVCLLLISFPPQ